MASGVYLTFFGSFVFGTPGFPLSDVPLQEIATKVEQGRFNARPSRVFRFEDIREAHRAMETNEVPGKIVVKVGERMERSPEHATLQHPGTSIPRHGL